jgi:hypothetical protein
LVQTHSSLANRVVDALIRPGDVAVEGDRNLTPD